MLRSRCVLEVVKLLPAEDILHNAVQVCSLWHEVADSNELWQTFLSPSDTDHIAGSAQSAKDRYRANRPKSQRLIVVGRDMICLFDCSNERWSQELPLSRETNVNEWSSFAFLEQGVVLACGGDRGAPGDPKSFCCSNRAFAIRMEGTLRLRDMTHCRERHGLIVYQATAYVFGGRCGTEQPLRASEALSLTPVPSLAEREWNRLPEMLAPRFAFNPCHDGKLIYLCGGVTNTSETFYPATLTFAPLNFKLPDESFSHSAVVFEGDLVILSRLYLNRWSLKRKKMESIRHKGLRGNVSGYMNSVYSQGFIYRPGIGAILKFSLANLSEAAVEIR